MGKPVTKPRVDKLDRLLDQQKNKPGRGLTDQEAIQEETQRRERKAKRSRDRRARQAVEMKRIKALLKMPAEEILAQARARAIEQARTASEFARAYGVELSPTDGEIFMPDAERGKGRIVTGGMTPTKMDQIDVHRLTNEGGGHRVNGQGAAPVSNTTRDDEGDYDPRVGRGSFGWDDFKEASSGRLRVILNNSGEIELDRALNSLVQETFVNDVCRLCLATVEDQKKHILNIHGEDGGMIAARIRKQERDDSRLRKAGKAVLAAAEFPNRVTARPEEAERQGYVQGPLTQVVGGRWVREWVKPK